MPSPVEAIPPCVNCGGTSGDHDPWPTCPNGQTEYEPKGKRQ